MKSKYLLKRLILATILILNLTAFGQSSTDSVTISRQAQRNCLMWYMENVYKDSIILAKDSYIEVQTVIIDKRGREISACNDSLDVARLDNTTLKKKVVKNRRIAIGGFSAFLLAIGLFFVN